MTPARFTIRPATKADRAGLEALFVELQDVERAMERNRLPGRDCAEAHIGALIAWTRGADGGFLIAESEAQTPERQRGRETTARLLGFICYGVEEEMGRFVLPENQRFGLISDIVVTQTARGRGIGAALMAAAEDELRAFGVRRVEVCTLAQNRAARDVYARLGFRESHITFARDL